MVEAGGDKPNNSDLSGVIPPKTDERQDINLDELPSAQGIGKALKEITGTAIAENIATKIVDLSTSEAKAVIHEDEIWIDESAMLQKASEVPDVFAKAIRESIVAQDRRRLDVYTHYFKGEGVSEEAQKLLAEIEKAFEAGSADNLQLDELRTSLPTRTIGERQVIKEEVNRQIQKNFPFLFKDGNGEILSVNPADPEADIDIVIINDKKKITLVLGSKKGIPKISAPKSIPNNMFGFPLPSEWKKDAEGNFMVPMSASANGEEPLFSGIIIMREPVDLASQFNTEEEDAESEEYEPLPGMPINPNYRKPRAQRPTYSYVPASSSH